MEGLFGTLGLNLPSLLIQLLNFLLLLLLLRRLLYKPVLRRLEQRSQRIRNDLDEARRLREEAERDRLEYRTQLERARDEARAVLEEANQVSERIREQALLDAEGQSARLLERAREGIARERDLAITELRREVADLAIAAASRVVRRALDTPAQRQLVREVLAELNGVSGDGRPAAAAPPRREG